MLIDWKTQDRKDINSTQIIYRFSKKNFRTYQISPYSICIFTQVAIFT